MQGFLQDVRYAARVMIKGRGLTAVAVATLALGIGANTAIFSAVNAVVLRPLPYPEADRLVMVWQDLRARGGPATEWTGPSQHFDWKAEKAVFENLMEVGVHDIIGEPHTFAELSGTVLEFLRVEMALHMGRHGFRTDVLDRFRDHNHRPRRL